MKLKKLKRLTGISGRAFLPLLYVALLVASLLTFHASKAFAFAGGNGTSGNPYQITTPAELQSLNSNLGSTLYFKVMNNIDLNVSPYNTGSGWTPIGSSSTNFQGNFDGNFKTISNLYISRSGTNYQGLFGAAASGSTIKNVILSTANVTGSTYVGSLVGSTGGTISRAGVTGGTITGFQRVGGLIGSGGTVSYAYSNNSVVFHQTGTSTCCSGGLTGEASTSTSNSYSRSTVASDSNTLYNQGAMGGFLGNDYLSGAKTNLYSTGTVTTASGSLTGLAGGITGSNYTSNYTSTYWDTQTSGWSTSGGGSNVVGKTTSLMKTQSTFSGWDFTNVWAIDGTSTINDGYPYLQWQTSLTEINLPNAPTSLSPASGTASTATQPTLSFTQSDADSGETVKYQIQIDDTADFSSPTVDYTSALIAQGSTSFTVGQAAGSGTYTIGSSGQTLAEGSYYWRVKSTDATGLVSSYATANNGSIAFKVDTTVPSVPGTPNLTTPVNDTTPTWTWTASTDNIGLATNAYSVQWSQSSTFASGNTSTTSTTATYTHSVALSSGTWYFHVRAVDGANNASAYSAISSVTIDGVAPTVPGTPSATSVLGSPTPNLTWTASTDAGSGLASPAYTVQYSQSSGFSSGVTTATSSTNSYTIPTLSDGTWYFHVRASDVAGNNSAYSTTYSFVVDATVPTTPGTPSTTTPSSTATPAWTWAASSDSGIGLASPAYTLQWSQSATFTSTIFSTTSNSASYTHSTALADGTWYFRVFSTDLAGNASANSANGTVVVDATEPTVPGTPVTATPTNSSSPTFSWAASTDAGTGVNHYDVRWSSDPVFGSYSYSSTAGAVTSYTIPLSLSDGTWYFKVAGVDGLSQSSAFSTSGTVVIDTAAPTLSSVTPLNAAADVAKTTTLTMVFNEPVNASTGNIKIYRSDNTLIETIAANGGQVSGTGTTTLTIAPANLEYSTSYYVLVDITALSDVATNSYAGLSSHSAWTFTTAPEPATPPVSTPSADTTLATTDKSVAEKVTPATDVATTETISPDSTLAATPIVLNNFTEYVSGQGKELGLIEQQVVRFTVKAETHTAMVSDMGDDWVKITLHSDPITDRLKVGETKKYDVDKDGTNDISITLNGITNGVAELVFKQLAAVHSSLNAVASESRSDVIRWWLTTIAVVLIGVLLVAKVLHSKSKA